ARPAFRRALEDDEHAAAGGEARRSVDLDAPLSDAPAGRRDDDLAGAEPALERLLDGERDLGEQAAVAQLARLDPPHVTDDDQMRRANEVGIAHRDEDGRPGCADATAHDAEEGDRKS